MKKLPVLLSIPHGGDKTPRELVGRVCLSEKDRFGDGDAYTREIYGIKEDVTALVDTQIARVFIDLNRDTEDRPPQNPDGIVKTQTCHGPAVYHPEKQLNPDLIETLIQKYYHPYHQKLRKTLESHPNLKLALDCHSMEAVGPAISPDPGKKRPKICLGSYHGKSCPPETVARMARCFREAFNLNETAVTIDQPFAGGFITRTYGNRPIPFIQVEMNRILYLSDPWFDRERLTVTPSRLQELQEKFRQALVLFFSEY